MVTCSGRGQIKVTSGMIQAFGNVPHPKSCGGQKSTPGCVPLQLSTLSFETGSLCWAGSLLLGRTSWPVSCRDAPVPILVAGIAVMSCCSHFLCGYQECELSSSCLYDKPFLYRATFLAPCFYWYRCLRVSLCNANLLYNAGWLQTLNSPASAS